MNTPTHYVFCCCLTSDGIPRLILGNDVVHLILSCFPFQILFLSVPFAHKEFFPVQLRQIPHCCDHCFPRFLSRHSMVNDNVLLQERPTQINCEGTGRQWRHECNFDEKTNFDLPTSTASPNFDVNQSICNRGTFARQNTATVAVPVLFIFADTLDGRLGSRDCV